MLCKRRLNLLLFWRSPCCSLRASGSRVTSRDSPKWRALLAGYRYRAVLVAKTPYNLKTDPCGQRQQYHRQDTALECLTKGVKHGRIADSRTVACSRLSDSGEDAKEKGTRKVGGAGKRKGERASAAPALPSSFLFIFVFALSQFSGPDYLGAWNRLLELQIKMPDFLSTRFGAWKVQRNGRNL